MTAPNNKPLSMDDSSRFAKYFRKNSGWGCLSLVLNNKNIKDSHVDHCLEQAAQMCNAEAIYLAQVLKSMSKSQRLKLANIDFSNGRRF